MTHNPIHRAVHCSVLSPVLTAALALGLAGLAPGAMASDDPAARDLTVEQTAVFSVQAPTPTSTTADRLHVVAWVDRADNTYAVGERVRLFVQVNRDAYLTVLNVGPSGNTTVLFPNAGQRDARIRSGKALEIPAPGSGVSIEVRGPSLGRELIKVVASSEPAPVFAPAALSAAGPFSVVSAGAQSAARDLKVTMAGPAAQEWDDYNKVITTVAARPTAASAPVSWPEPMWGLQLATDRSGYRFGEAVTLHVRAASPCWLTLVNTGPSGNMRVLLPNVRQPHYLLVPGQTLSFPGTGLRLAPMGPAGIETVTAICSADDRPIAPASLGFDRDGFGTLEAAGGARDLALTAATPGRRTAQATVGFLVTP
ncbi:MAG: DUF4384 domain-containing protein [Alphaproteobacteria bacterium]|nr:DUF4384 domain-containing protein [Alphaproteobacteria bacterium]